MRCVLVDWSLGVGWAVALAGPEGCLWCARVNQVGIGVDTIINRFECTGLLDGYSVIG